MPTYKNNTDTAINYTHKGKLYSFPPHKEYPAAFWVPYKELGLELVSEDFPPVPDSLLLSGTFRFDKKLERKFNFQHCDKYKFKISVIEGRVKLYAGSSKVGAEIEADYEKVFEWDKAPYVRIIGAEETNIVRIDAEAL